MPGPPRRVTGVGVHPMCRRRPVRRPPRRAHLQRGPRLSPAMVGLEPGPLRGGAVVDDRVVRVRVYLEVARR